MKPSPQVAAQAVPPNNLNEALAGTVGRRAEIETAIAALRTARLLCLTGAGGAGKTHLAKQVAADLLHCPPDHPNPFPDGVWFAEFQKKLSDPALVPEVIATAMKVEAGKEPIRTLVQFLRPKKLLLVLDNCDHVLDPCREVVRTLLQQCHWVRVLATSREPLDRYGDRDGLGEDVLDVPPLPIEELRCFLEAEPDGGLPPPKVCQNPAFRLFVEQAKRVHMVSDGTPRGFQLAPETARKVAESCVRLSGLPQAILLAAGQARLHTMDEILDSLRALFGPGPLGQDLARVLGETLDWSFNRLTGPQQQLLRRLSVFAGGWSPKDAVRAVCGEAGDEGGAGGAEDDLIAPQHELVRKSFIVADVDAGQQKARYRLLETIRGYARSKLDAAEAAALADRHARYFLELAVAWEPKFRGAEQVAALLLLEREHDNIRAAQEWFANRPDGAGDLLTLTVALSHLYYIRGLFTEGRRWLERGLSLARPDRIPAQTRAAALNLFGIFAYHQADYELAEERLIEGMKLFSLTKDKLGVSIALSGLAFLAYRRNQHYKARRLYYRSLARLLDLDPDDSRETQWYKAWVQCDLALVLHLEDDQHRAARLLQMSSKIRRRIGDRWGTALALNYLGRVIWAEAQGAAGSERAGKTAEAVRLQEESLMVSRAIGYRRGIALASQYRGAIHEALGEFGEAARLYRESLRVRRAQGDVSGVAACLEAFAGLANTRGDAGRAARLFGAAGALREKMHEEPEPFDKKARGLGEAASRQALGEEGYEAARRAGHEMDCDEAVHEAMSGGENEPGP